MKLVIIIATLFAVALASRTIPGKPAPVNKECMRETGVRRDQIKDFDIEKLEASKELRCYRRCADIKDGRLLENNMPNTDSPEMARKMPPGAELEKIKMSANECQMETGSVADPCDNWLAMLKCMTKKFGH